MSIKWANISKSPQIGTWHLILLFTIIVITIILLVSLQGTPFLPHQEASISSSMGWGSWKPKSGSDESCRLFALCTVKPPLSQEIRACFPYGKWKEKIMNHYLQRSPCQLWWWFYDCMYVRFHRTVHFKLVKFIVCKFYFNKTDKKLPCYMNNTIFKEIILGGKYLGYGFLYGGNYYSRLSYHFQYLHHKMKSKF